MTADTKTTDHLETLSRGLALLRHFGEGNVELSIQDAADFLSISRGAARRFLITLMNDGYLDRKSRTFRINPKVIELGYSYFSGLDLPAIAQPILDDIAERTGENCGLYILHNSDVVVIGTSGGVQNFTFVPKRGAIFPAYATAVGRLLLADLPLSDLDAFLAKADLHPLTPHTVKSAAALRKAVLLAREQGYAVVANELAYGMAGVALPIRDAAGRWIAAVNMSLQRGGAPEEMVDVCRPILTQAADEISAIFMKLGRRDR